MNAISNKIRISTRRHGSNVKLFSGTIVKVIGKGEGAVRVRNEKTRMGAWVSENELVEVQ